MSVKKQIIASNKFISFDNPKERWRNMKNDFDGTYYVSNLGRIMRLNSFGIFTEITTKLVEGSLQAVFQNGNIQRLRRVSGFVLKYFGKGWRKYRLISYKDGNKCNCSLNNLEWRTGFDDGVDYEYLNKIKTMRLNTDDMLVVKYLLEKNIAYLFEAFENNINRVYSLCFKMNVSKKNVFENKATIVLMLADKIDKGHYKPKTIMLRAKRHYSQYFHSFINKEVQIFLSEEKRSVKPRNNETLTEDFIETLNYKNKHLKLL